MAVATYEISHNTKTAPSLTDAARIGEAPAAWMDNSMPSPGSSPLKDILNLKRSIKPEDHASGSHRASSSFFAISTPAKPRKIRKQSDHQSMNRRETTNQRGEPDSSKKG